MTDTRSDERVTQAEMGDPSNAGKEVATSAPRDNARAQQLKNLRDGVLADVEAHRGDLTQILNATGGETPRFAAQNWIKPYIDNKLSSALSAENETPYPF